jgi:hypothetical protein
MIEPAETEIEQLRRENRAWTDAFNKADRNALPICAVMGVIAGHPMACGDCNPCGAAHIVPEPVRQLLSELREWMDKYEAAAHKTTVLEFEGERYPLRYDNGD